MKENRLSALFSFRIKKLLLLITIFVVVNEVQSQDSRDENKTIIDKQEWEARTNGVSYFEEPPPPPPPPPDNSFLQFLSRLFKDIDIASILRLLAYGLLIAILAVVIYILISKRIFEWPAQKSDLSLEKQVERISDKEKLNELLQKALDEKQFALAVRIKFILLLRTLDDLNVVKFQIDKTNGNYIDEFAAGKHVNDFRKVVMIFENIWYGKKPVTQRDFDVINNFYNNFTLKFPEK